MDNVFLSIDPKSASDIVRQAERKKIISAEMRDYLLNAIHRTYEAEEVTDIHVDEYYCPACGAENIADEGEIYDSYCPNCGQKLFVASKYAEY